MIAAQKNELICLRLNAFGILLSCAEAAVLRRAAKRLHRWAELECGDGNSHWSWCLTRAETGRPFLECTSHKTGLSTSVPYPDYERGALKRIEAVCVAHDAFYYAQPDPRGCSLYVSTQKLDSSNYDQGVAICA